MLKTKVCGTD